MTNIPELRRLLIVSALEKPTREEQIKEINYLLTQAYKDGETAGREKAINQIFTYHPKED